MEQIYLIDKEHDQLRIDKVIPLLDSELTRSHAQKLIEQHRIRLDGVLITQNRYKVSSGQTMCIEMPDPEPLNIIPEDIPLDVVYEDNDIILINKPKGMVVHPAPGHASGTLVNALLHHCGDNLSGINGTLRPGIVHRIDRDTTGILVICKNDRAHLALSKQLAEHSITRRYYAIVQGKLKEDGTINAPIGRHPLERKKMAIVQSGRRAVTHYRVLEFLTGNYTLIECQLETGRTHQIRVHMASIHHPLLGDEVYGSSKQPYHTCGQVLHAGVLGIIHPSTGEYMEFSAPLPQYFQDLLTKLRI